MKELWIGLVEILTPQTDSGDTRAFSKVVARASSETDFQKFVRSVCEKYDWSLLAVEDCNPLANLVDITNEELLETIERAKGFPEACIFTTLHYYPSKPS